MVLKDNILQKISTFIPKEEKANKNMEMKSNIVKCLHEKYESLLPRTTERMPRGEIPYAASFQPSIPLRVLLEQIHVISGL